MVEARRRVCEVREVVAKHRRRCEDQVMELQRQVTLKRQAMDELRSAKLPSGLDLIPLDREKKIIASELEESEDPLRKALQVESAGCEALRTGIGEATAAGDEALRQAIAKLSQPIPERATHVGLVAPPPPSSALTVAEAIPELEEAPGVVMDESVIPILKIVDTQPLRVAWSDLVRLDVQSDLRTLTKDPRGEERDQLDRLRERRQTDRDRFIEVIEANCGAILDAPSRGPPPSRDPTPTPLKAVVKKRASDATSQRAIMPSKTPRGRIRF